MSTFEHVILGYLDNAVRLLKAQPINLGGYAASGGGAGGPPGGFVGSLPQTRVTYDYTEAEVLDLPPSGISLLDNLNRIRYRIGELEVAISGGVDVYEDSVEIGPNVTVLNFSSDFDVTLDSSDQVTISLFLGSGETYSLSGVFNEDLYAQIPGTDFTTANVFAPNTLEVYYNGLRIPGSGYTENGSLDGFTTAFSVGSSDTLTVDYEVTIAGPDHYHNNLVTYDYLLSGYYTISEINTYMSLYALADHTHEEADITDLIHDADFIGGFAVASGLSPTDGSVLYYEGSVSAFSTKPISVNQQFIFTVADTVDTSIEGTLPLRIYAHEVNDSAIISEVFMYVNTAPVTNSIQVGILKNGANLITSPGYLEIGTGSNSVTGTSFTSSTFTKDDYFQLTLVQGDDGGASDLTVHIRFSYNI